MNKTLEFVPSFKTSLGYTVDFQAVIDYDEKTVEVIAAWEIIGSEQYHVMPDVVFSEDDDEAIQAAIFKESKENC